MFVFIIFSGKFQTVTNSVVLLVQRRAQPVLQVWMLVPLVRLVLVPLRGVLTLLDSPKGPVCLLYQLFPHLPREVTAAHPPGEIHHRLQLLTERLQGMLCLDNQTRQQVILPQSQIRHFVCICILYRVIPSFKFLNS
jgi:hypothetical protein